MASSLGSSLPDSKRLALHPAGDSSVSSPERGAGPKGRSVARSTPSSSLPTAASAASAPASPGPAPSLGTTPIRNPPYVDLDARAWRWWLRDMMSSDPRTPKRIAECGWFARTGMVELRSIASCVYPAQLIVCARAWPEPVCSAKIRARKAIGLEEMIKVHGEAGGGITFATFTSGEHRLSDSLESSLAILRGAWDKLIHCNRYERIKERYGLMGLVLAYEFTYGEEFGHHPHLHALWFHREPLPAQGMVDVHMFMWDRWRLAISKTGRYLHPEHGIDLKMNADDVGLGGYVAKVQEGDWGVAQELTKGDLKTARKMKSRTPFMLVRDHYLTGDMADWTRWQEFTAAVMLTGNRSIPVCRMTPGLRKAVLGDDVAPQAGEEQMAAMEVGGVLIAVMTWQVWTRVRRLGLGPAVLKAGEADGLEGINALLASHGFGYERALPPLVRGEQHEQAVQEQEAS